MTLSLTAAGASDRGQAREVNEDALLIDEELGLFAVADGLGGRAAGEVASREALDVFHREIRRKAKVIDRAREDAGQLGELRRVAVEAAETACAHVHRRGSTDPRLAGMASTLTALVLAGPRGVMAHAGDSRLYLHRDGDVEQLSTDHTAAWEAWRSGELSHDDAHQSRLAHVLTRCLGAQPETNVEALRLDVLPDDTFILCTDGLTKHLDSDGELSGYVVSEPLPNIPGKLVDLCNARGGADNITVVAVRCAATDTRHGELRALGSAVRAELAALRRVDAFQEIRFPHLLRLRNAATATGHRAGDLLVRAGDPVGALHVLLEGSCEARSDEGTLALRPGVSFGVDALVGTRTARRDVVATRDGRMLRLGQEAFHNLCRRRPWFGVDVLRRLASATPPAPDDPVLGR